MGNWWETPKELGREDVIFKNFEKISNPLNNLQPGSTFKNFQNAGSDLFANEHPELLDPELRSKNDPKPQHPVGPIGIENGEGGPQANPAYVSPAEHRTNDFQTGIDFAKNYFGEGNPEMAQILAQRKERALGLNKNEVQAYRERGSQGINQQMATGIRALKGVQASSGVRGGAAGAQAIPIVNRADQARAGLERDISIADMERRSKELGDYEHTLTGERAGTLGTGFGFAGMGAADRANEMEYGLGKDFLNTYKADAGKNVDLGIQKPWHQKASQHWADVLSKWF